MSSTGTGRGRGRGRGRGGSHTQSQPQEAPASHSDNDQELSSQNFSPPSTQESKQSRQKRVPAKSAEELRRVMDIIQSRISIIIDSLEGDDNDASLKRNVSTAVKHLKQINDLLTN